MMGSASALTIEEYEIYAKADTVKDFYYTISVSVNGDDNLKPVSSEEERETESENDSSKSNKGFGGGVCANYL